MGIKNKKMRKIKTFDDLKFAPHQVVPGAVRAFMKFPQGQWISVVGGGKSSLYGDGKTTFEVLSSKNEEEPFGYQTKDEVSTIMADLQTPVI
jgi:hypothetical protein